MTLNRLLLLLFLKAVLLGLVIAFFPIGLAPDEAQYWTWSRALDWGYYSKPPAIAWQIWLTTSLFGSNAFGVRAGALVLGFSLPLVVYFIGKKYSEQIAFWGAVVLAFSPLGCFLSFAATTDSGSILFLTLAIAAAPHFLLSGLFILCAALYKWTAFVFWPAALLFYRRKSMIGGFALSLLAFLPPLYWNATHDFATFRHVGNTLYKKGGAGANFFDFLASQIGLLSPIYFLLLVWGMVFLIRCFRQVPRSLLFEGAFPLALLIFFAAALFTKVQPNWAAFLYPSGMAVLAWGALPKGRPWLHVGTWLSTLIVALVFLSPWLPIPYRLSPLRQNLGWGQLAAALTKAGYLPSHDVLIGDKYQTASLLSFYGPGQRRAYFLNLSGQRKNQFSYWEPLAVGADGYFAVIENRTKGQIGAYEKHYLPFLAPYFEEVTYAGAFPLVDEVKWVVLFKCLNYNGLEAGPSKEY